MDSREQGKVTQQSVLSCKCCGYVGQQVLLYTKNGVPILQCPHCGVGRADVAEFNALEYYDEAYFNGTRSDGYSDYVAAKEVLYEHFRTELSAIQGYTAAKGKLLELGCAYGYFLEMAAHQYEQVYGLGICAEAVTDCHRRGLTTVKQGTISRQSLEGFPTVDTAVMLDVIEHLPDPREALQAVLEKLVPRGHLFLTTGDFSSLAARLLGRHWRLMTPPQHLWFFTPESLRMLGASLGLEVIAVSHPAKKVPVGLIAYQLARFVNLRASLPAWLQKRGVMVNLFDAVRVVMRKNP